MAPQLNYIAQWAANTSTAFGALVLFSSGLYMIYATRRFVSFATIIPFTLCPYLVMSAGGINGIPFPFALTGGILLSGLVLLLLDWAVNGVLAERRASTFTFMLASFALAIAALNAVSLIWGDEGRLLGDGSVEVGSLVLGARITRVQILTIAAGASSAAAILVMLSRTRIGRAVRALGNDAFLAECAGLNGAFLSRFAAFLSGCLAGVAGVLVGYDSALSPTFGMPILFLGVVAAVIGGMNSFSGVILGCLLVPSMQQAMIIAIGGRWYELVIFAAFVLCLVIRPGGIMGKASEEAKT